MTEKELEIEAKKLILQFYQINEKKQDSDGTSPYISRNYAKQCAIISTELTIDAIKKCSIVAGYPLEDYQLLLNVLNKM